MYFLDNIERKPRRKSTLRPKKPKKRTSAHRCAMLMTLAICVHLCCHHVLPACSRRIQSGHWSSEDRTVRHARRLFLEVPEDAFVHARTESPHRPRPTTLPAALSTQETPKGQGTEESTHKKDRKDTKKRHGFKEKEEDDEVPIPSYIYAGEITLVIVLSLLFEMGQELIREKAEEAAEVIEALFKELTILGFVGLLVYIVTKTGVATSLAEDLVPGFHGEGENPLAESFEMIHMVIFCVMMVFIFQALGLMYVSYELTRKWHRWENISAKGTSKSIEILFRQYGYLDQKGRKGKTYKYPGIVHRMLVQDDIHALLQWRALRHEFLFPSRENANELANVIRVKEPGSFDFQMYLSKRLRRVFIELVEIDMLTWIVALLTINPMLLFGQGLSPNSLCMMQTIIAWTMFGITAIVLADLTRVVDQLTPELSDNAQKIIRYFHGTSKAALLRLQKERKLMQAEENADDDPFQPIERTSVGKTAADHGDGTKVSLLRRSVVFVPPLHQPTPDVPGANRIHMFFVGGKMAHMPNLQHRLFFFQEKGIEMYASLLEIIMFFEAVLVASLIVDILEICKFCIVQSIEYEKDRKIIEQVVFTVKQERLQEALEVLRLVKLRGRAKKLEGQTISQEEFDSALAKFQHMPKQKQTHYANIFLEFDKDNSGTIDAEELSGVLESLGIVKGSEASFAALELVGLCDLTGSKSLSPDEFKVLITLSMEKRTPEEEKTDIKAFFRQIDKDQSGKLTINEIHEVFTRDLNCDLSPAFIATLINQCFKQAKHELTEKEFVKWLQHLEGHESAVGHHGEGHKEKGSTSESESDAETGSISKKSGESLKLLAHEATHVDLRSPRAAS
eukprot:GEMP01011790.1.p1 GENE.GEMP01011790.1~~GEMP01011790.1.p1  ORF type:complete len:849 (+),score=187.26 GEMP01011790.1:146-2692(+)